MRDFEDISAAGAGDRQPTDCDDEMATFGKGVRADRHEARSRSVAPFAAGCDVRYRARRLDRPWATHTSRLPAWRAATHGRGLAS